MTPLSLAAGGSMTSGGVLTPSAAGNATITATSSQGLSNTATFVVESKP